MNTRLCLVVVLGSFLLSGCSNEINYAQVQVINGLYYKLGDTDPFTGKVHGDPLNAFGALTVATCEAEVSKGKYDGSRICKAGDKTAAELNYKNGLQEGTQKIWNIATGKLSEQSVYKEGKYHGKRELFNGNTGKTVRIEHYDQGVLSGEYKQWEDDGEKLIADLQYDHGKKSGTTYKVEAFNVVDENTRGYKVGGYTEKVENWKDDKLDGKVELYAYKAESPDNKMLVSEQEYKANKPVGISRVYLNGEVTDERQYDDNGVPLKGFLRSYKGNELLSEVSLVPVQSKAGVVFGKEGLEKAWTQGATSADKIYTEITWEKGLEVARKVEEYSSDRRVSSKEYARLNPLNSDDAKDQITAQEYGRSTGLVQVGTEKQYDKDGNLVKEIQYENDHPVSGKQYLYNGGWKWYEASFKTRKSEGTFDRPVLEKDGVEHTLNQDGKVIEEITWTMGVPGKKTVNVWDAGALVSSREAYDYQARRYMDTPMRNPKNTSVQDYMREQ